MNSLLKRVGVVHPWFHGGGGEAVCVHTLEALKKFGEIHLLTFDSVDFLQLDKYYGTALHHEMIKVVQLPYPRVLKWLPRGNVRFGALWKSLASRKVKHLASQYDLLISTYNEMDFGKPGIQYIHFPDMDVVASTLAGMSGFLHTSVIIRWFYLNIIKLLTGFSVNRIKDNLTVVNSYWTAEIVRRFYNVECKVVYPPVPDDLLGLPWEKREDGFICIGRIHPSKRIEFLIEILKGVRKAGFNIHFHIIGPRPKSRYTAKIEKLCMRNSSWCTLEGALPREELVRVMASHKYGIHGMPREHFGIAVAEMAKAGCIVFIPADGGQTEIINFSELQYHGLNDAQNKILAILQRPDWQKTLHQKIQTRANMFSAIAFQNKIKEIANTFFQYGIDGKSKGEI